jgi:hypothetical protein
MSMWEETDDESQHSMSESAFFVLLGAVARPIKNKMEQRIAYVS